VRVWSRSSLRNGLTSTPAKYPSGRSPSPPDELDDSIDDVVVPDVEPVAPEEPTRP
jgi:hypothetical protein